MRSGTAAILEVLVKGQPPRRTSIFFMPTIASKRALCFVGGDLEREGFVMNEWRF
jgi:hypothetical protein